MSASLADPVGANPLVAAVLWLQYTVLGTVALTVAIVAVATVGLMMLSGRVNVRYGVTVIAGCFILFGASSIVAGIQSAVGIGSALPEASASTAASERYDSPIVIPPARTSGYDPYAGASVPRR